MKLRVVNQKFSRALFELGGDTEIVAIDDDGNAMWIKDIKWELGEGLYVYVTKEPPV